MIIVERLLNRNLLGKNLGNAHTNIFATLFFLLTIYLNVYNLTKTGYCERDNETAK